MSCKHDAPHAKRTCTARRNHSECSVRWYGVGRHASDLLACGQTRGTSGTMPRMKTRMISSLVHRVRAPAEGHRLPRTGQLAPTRKFRHSGRAESRCYFSVLWISQTCFQINLVLNKMPIDAVHKADSSGSRTKPTPPASVVLSFVDAARLGALLSMTLCRLAALRSVCSLRELPQNALPLANALTRLTCPR